MEMKIIYLRLKPCTMEQKGTINVTGTTDLLHLPKCFSKGQGRIEQER